MASGDTGNVATDAVFLEENSDFSNCAALGAAVAQQIDPELSRIIDAWASLPPAIRRTMLALNG